MNKIQGNNAAAIPAFCGMIDKLWRDVKNGDDKKLPGAYAIRPYKHWRQYEEAVSKDEAISSHNNGRLHRDRLAMTKSIESSVDADLDRRANKPGVEFDLGRGQGL